MSLHIVEKGNGYPIVFGHSYLWDAHMWDPQVNELSKEYHCLGIELWNHGQSPNVPKSPYSIEEMAEAYYQAVLKQGIKEFAFVGLSVGGMIGVELALKYPKAVKALVVSASHVGREPASSLTEYLGLMDRLDREAKISQEFAKELASYFFTKETLKNNPTLVNRFVQSLVAYPPQRIQGLTTIGRGIFNRKDRMKDLSQIQCPTLYMVGADDIARPPHESQEMAKATPHSECVIVPNAAHVNNLEQPEFVTNHLKSFLKKSIDFKHVAGF
ncbi:MAG: alpha/beta hydrolase [Alphaproteobacteria bacterium]|nr:alpha/beta hydrolase [Alphaproteobacteria bacterium]